MELDELLGHLYSEEARLRATVKAVERGLTEKPEHKAFAAEVARFKAESGGLKGIADSPYGPAYARDQQRYYSLAPAERQEKLFLVSREMSLEFESAVHETDDRAAQDAYRELAKLFAPEQRKTRWYHERKHTTERKD